MKFNYLTNDFYIDYDKQTYPELMQKLDRPYTQVLTTVDGFVYAIPLRSSINHKYVYWTNKKNGCGLDFSKAVVMVDANKYVDKTKKPYDR